MTDQGEVDSFLSLDFTFSSMNRTDDWVPVMRALADTARLGLVHAQLASRGVSVREFADCVVESDYIAGSNRLTHAVL